LSRNSFHGLGNWRNNHVEWKPNWTLDPADKMAVTLSMALYRHCKDTFHGATDEQLQAVAMDILLAHRKDLRHGERTYRAKKRNG
jgi:hypothetical protein